MNDSEGAAKMTWREQRTANFQNVIKPTIVKELKGSCDGTKSRELPYTWSDIVQSELWSFECSGIILEHRERNKTEALQSMGGKMEKKKRNRTRTLTDVKECKSRQNSGGINQAFLKPFKVKHLVILYQKLWKSVKTSERANLYSRMSLAVK